MKIRTAAAAAWSLLAAAVLCSSDALAQVYRWVDEDGVIHLSSEKPPPGVKAERLDIPGTSKRSGSSPPARPTVSAPSGSAPRVTAAQRAQREDLLERLRTRECVVALEALDRKTSGTEATDAAEIRRLKQTADQNCSRDPLQRSRQEEMAAKLRVANSPSCAQARNQLADMLAPGAGTPREQLRTQQAFVDEHCTSPVR